MQMLKNKTMATVIAIILISSMAISLGAFSTVKAYNYNTATQTAVNQGMYWVGMDANASALRLLLWNRFQDKIPTHVYIITAPSPIGIGQTCNIVMFNPQVPPNGLATILTGFPARYSYTFTVKKPDGTVQNFPTATAVSYSAWSQNSVANGVFVSDSTGSTYMSYTPDQVGNYTLTVHFLQLQYLWNATNSAVLNNDYYGVTWLASDYTTTLTVQQEPVSLHGFVLPNIPPLPTEYWTRPIEGQNVGWYQVASNWLNSVHDFNYGGYQNMIQPDGVAPNTGHILWTRPTEDQGVVGGNDLSRPGNVFDAGAQYQPRFTTKIIMYGRLYYSPNLYATGSSEMLDCVDLKTGKLLWEVNTTSFYNAAPGFAAGLGQSSTGNMPQFGYYYSEDTPNEHGIDNPGWLFTNNYGIGYQPERGIPEIHIANVPGSTAPTGAAIAEVQGPSGENVRYVFTNLGNSTNPKWYLAQWNSSKVVPGVYGGGVTSYLIEGNVPITPAQPKTALPFGQSWVWNGTMWVTSPTANAQGIASGAPAGGGTWYNQAPSYDWNISSPIQFPTVSGGAPTIAAASLTNGILWGWNASGSTSYGASGNGWPTGTSGPNYAYPENVTVWAISLNPSSLGQLLSINTIKTDDPIANTNMMIEKADADATSDGVFVTIRVPDMAFFIYNMRTGALIGQTDSQAETISPYGYYTWPSLISMTQTKIAYGMLYTGGYGGTVSAYYLTNASLAWRTEIIPAGTAGVIKSSPGMMGMIADGKIYVGTHEHSAETPLEAGNDLKCLNATTGQYIWRMSGWAYPLAFAVADGVLIYWNNYDGQVYAVGKGPSAATVQAPLTAITVGDNVVIQGTVMDISAGTKQNEQAARFPNGVPAVSDASMSAWMDCVYMQKGWPSNATGVDVTIDAVDPNGNFVHLGTATSDTSGLFSYAWKTPDIPGKYTVIATFGGSESYYASYAETAMVVQEAPPAPATATPPPAAPLPPFDMYILAATVVIIIAIAIVGILLLRKRP
jgi:outer membrane protein assembly factor BamB